MKYKKTVEARFIERPNRFIARVELCGREEVVHVKNTGRCKELLKEGVTVFLDEPEGKHRKTKYDLVAVIKKKANGEEMIINIDSQAPNDAVAQWLPVSGLFADNAKILREVTFGNSRFDFAVTEPAGNDEDGATGEKITFVEVKGVTLEEGGIVMFPDAPTERGRKHLNELARLVSEGYGAIVIFVVQMKGASGFKPNSKTDPEFASALENARNSGVKILAYDSVITPNEMKVDKPVKLIF